MVRYRFVLCDGSSRGTDSKAWLASISPATALARRSVARSVAQKNSNSIYYCTSYYLFGHNGLTGSGQGFRCSVNGVIGVEWKVTAAVALDEEIKVGGTVVLNGHGGKGRADVGIGGFGSLDSGQGTSNGNHGGSDLLGLGSDRSSRGKGILLGVRQKLQGLRLFPKASGLCYGIGSNLEVGCDGDDGTNDGTAGGGLRSGWVFLFEGRERKGDGLFKRSGGVVSGLGLGCLHEILDNVGRRKEMGFVSGNDIRGLFPELGSEDLVLVARKACVQLTLVHGRRSGRELGEVGVHVGPELILVLFHSQKLYLGRAHSCRHGIGVGLGVCRKIGLEVVQALGCRIGAELLVTRGNSIDQFDEILLGNRVFLPNGRSRFRDHPLDVFDHVLVSGMLSVDNTHHGVVSGGNRQLERRKSVGLAGPVDEDGAAAPADLGQSRSTLGRVAQESEVFEGNTQDGIGVELSVSTVDNLAARIDGGRIEVGHGFLFEVNGVGGRHGALVEGLFCGIRGGFGFARSRLLHRKVRNQCLGKVNGVFHFSSAVNAAPSDSTRCALHHRLGRQQFQHHSSTTQY
mmetsp:Transcript_18303/g.41991  ORF Transcript_18303/g.41991 Transcript_18303/m.41991 type:complete len:571 (-) Transcript_18303:217-1929(-)